MPRIKTATPIVNSGLDSDTAEQVFEQIARFAGYGFNKSHAAAYAAISFQTAWLKTHHTEAFFAAAMNLNLDKVAEIAVFVNELKRRGIALWAPSINQSRAKFEPLRLKKPWKGRDFGICYSLAAIRGVGTSAAHAIEAERKRGGAFRDVEDLISRTGDAVNRTALLALAKAGAFDCFSISRPEALAEVDGYRVRGNTAQMSMFDALEAKPDVKVPDLDTDAVLDNEFDVLGHFMSAHPLDEMASRMIPENLQFSGFVLESTRPLRSAAMPAVIVDTDVRRTNAGDVMAVLTLSDPDGQYEALAFGETFGEIRHLLRKKARVILNASISVRGDERRIIIEGAQPLTARRNVLSDQSHEDIAA